MKLDYEKSLYKEIIKTKNLDWFFYRYQLTRGMYLAYIEFFLKQRNFEVDRNRLKLLYQKYQFQCHLHEKKVGVLADLHIGNQENWNYIKSACSFFEQNKIKSILLLGDSFDGMSNQALKENRKDAYYSQINQFQSNFSDFFNLYVLLGNH